MVHVQEPAAHRPVQKRLPAEERRAQIIGVAREAFVELGMNGARTRDIAQRAGITEAYLYRHFHSKDELFELAIDEPLDLTITKLREETHELALRTDVDRVDVLLRSHELLLECMVSIAPLVAAALLSERPKGNQFYTDHLLPRLRDVLALVIPDITGFPLRAVELDLFVDAMIGIHLTIAMEHLLEGRSVDVPAVAKQVTRLFAGGFGRAADGTARSAAGRKRAASGRK